MEKRIDGALVSKILYDELNSYLEEKLRLFLFVMILVVKCMVR